MCPKANWFVYIIKTDKSQLYTGITTDIERRFSEHLSVFEKHKLAKGAKFFRSQKPLAVVYRKAFANRADASKLEWQIKKMSRKAKDAFIAPQQ